MGHLIEMLFKPPPMPNLDLPIAARLLPAIKVTLAKACEVIYYRGVYDGFIAGVLMAILFVPSIRNRAVKGAGSVIEHL